MWWICISCNIIYCCKIIFHITLNNSIHKRKLLSILEIKCFFLYIIFKAIRHCDDAERNNYLQVNWCEIVMYRAWERRAAADGRTACGALTDHGSLIVVTFCSASKKTLLCLRRHGRRSSNNFDELTNSNIVKFYTEIIY